MMSVPDEQRPEPSSLRSRRRWRAGALALATSAALTASAFSLAPAASAIDDGSQAPASEETVGTSATHTIAEVQGTAAESPLVGETVTVEGAVTADYRTGGYKGIVIQTADAFGENKTPGASDGLFVYLNNLAPELEIGDLVAVTGRVSEYYGQTQISPAAIDDIAVVQAGAGVPAPTPLPDTVLGDDREAYESMLVAPEGSYRLASSHQLYNYGTLWLNAGSELAVKSTETTRPGADADAIAAANQASRILLDDGWSSQVTSKSHTGEQPYFTTDAVVRNGDAVNFPSEGSILQYGFDEWRLQPIVPIDDTSDASHKPTFTTENPRPETAPEVGGDVQVASFNVYNYFTTLASENSNARGADTAEEFAIQKSKIVSAINGLDAEVVALMEIENGPKLGEPLDSALADLVAGLNEAAGSEVWDYVRTPEELNDAEITDYITSAIIYRKAAVTPKGDSQTQIDESVWGNAREPIAQTFDADGKIVTVVANHFKSKSAPDDAEEEPADGQGYFNADRVAQAESLLAFTDELQQSSGSEDLLLIGDFNAYGKEDPIDVFTQAGWTDLVPTQAAGQYTYTYDGELGSLDHVIASPSLTGSITGTGVWSINSPEWSDRGYAYGAAEAGTPFRSSDHDPILVGLSTELEPIDIDVMTINDFHGRIEANGASAGAAVVSGAVQELRDENPNTLFVANGDLIGASTFTSFIQQDNPTLDAMNAAGLQASSTGNHEFDQGWDDLSGRVADRADFPYLAANVYLAGTEDHALQPAWVTEVEGVSVGFIGAVTEELDSLVSPEGIADLEIRDVADSVNAVAAELTDGDPANGEADVIVLLVHEGAADATDAGIDSSTVMGDIVERVTDDVDAISSAHTHQVYNHVIDGRPVFQAGQYGENFALTSIQVDAKTKELISISNEIKPFTDDQDQPLYPADPEVQAIVDEAAATAQELGAVKVGSITADFNRARQSDGTENRGGESTAGNFVADVHQWATGADVALMNPGGIRANLTFAGTSAEDPDGNVSYQEAATVQPFANTLVTVVLTGAQLKSVLEEQWQPEGASRPFLKLGVSKGLQYTYDPDAESGSRITSITLNGEALDPEKEYTVAANSFLAAGGDNFFTLADGVDRKDTGKVDLQSTVEWFAEHDTATPDLAQRAVGAVLSPAADAQGYAAGEQVTLQLSSLAFSAGEAAPGAVSVSLGGEALATAEIDPAVVDTTDEVGRATLSFAVPAGASGAQTLEVAVEGTGTSVQLPITIASSGGGDSGSGADGSGSADGSDAADGSGSAGGSGNAEGSGGTAGSGATAGLATTGSDTAPYLLAAAALLVLGASGLLLARRRTRGE